MAGESDAGVGELAFSLLVSYFGAMELFYVIRHLIHWTFRHPATGESDSKSLQQLHDELRDQQTAAEAMEAAAGAHTMQDGVAYRDGIRIEKADLNSKAGECQEGEVPIETKKEDNQPQAEDIEQKSRQADKENDEEMVENTRKLIEDRDVERQHNEEKLVSSEKQREQAERLRELNEQDNAKQSSQLLNVDHRHMDSQQSQLASTRNMTEKLLEAERLRTLSDSESQLENEDEDEDEDAEVVANTRRLLANEHYKEEKQRRIEENARLFLEADEKLAALEQKKLEAIDNKVSEVEVSEPCVRKTVNNVKTQIGQTNRSEQSDAVISKSLVNPDPETDRQDPEGEDNDSNMRYSDEYLRSLDGIKSRESSGEDGSGRRRAFKKRRSSGSSNSSRESRTSRDEELKKSLESQGLRQDARIGNANEPTLKVKSHRSPLNSHLGSLEMLDEENTNLREELLNLSKANSPEKATDKQNKEGITRERSKEKDNAEAGKYPNSDDNNTNLQTSEIGEAIINAHASSSPRLRRSPRIDEMNQYEDLWRGKTETDAEEAPLVVSSPTISVQTPDTAPWRDQYGLLMEGLSDFYDFTASVNPSRSRSTSRQPSPANTPPKNVNNTIEINEENVIEIFDDSGFPIDTEINMENVIELIESTSDMAMTINLNGDRNVEGLLQNIADEPSTVKETLPMIHIVNEDLEQNLLLASVEQHDRTESSELQFNSLLPSTDYLEENLAANLIDSAKSDEHNDRIISSVPVEEISNLLADTQVNLKITITEEIEEGIYENPIVSDENTNQFVESLRAEQRTRSRSRSRSRSPLPTSDNIQRSLESRRMKRIQHNDEIFEKLIEKSQSPKSASPLPTIFVKCLDEEIAMEINVGDEEENTTESISKLVAQLRLERSLSRSRSQTPSRHKLRASNEALAGQTDQRSKSSEPKEVMNLESDGCPANLRNNRSLSPSRSRSISPSRSLIIDSSSDNDQLNEIFESEASESKVLNDKLEKLESAVAEKQHELDLKALHQLSNASEETELRLLSPTEIKREIEMQLNQENSDSMPCSRIISDNEPEITEECQSTPELITSDSKCTSCTDESLDLGNDYEGLRRKAAFFRRSLSPSRSMDIGDLNTARMYAATRQEQQAAVLESLYSASTNVTKSETAEKNLGAKPKTFEFDQNTLENEQSTRDTSFDIENMRQRTSEFLRSRSQSRSPLGDEQVEALKNIDAVVAKRELQDQLLDQFASSTINYQNFSRHLNTNFLDSERRASDSALIQKPELGMQYSENDYHLDLEPEEYHHFRRFSLAQEQPIEEYPSDDYVCISQIAVRTLTGRTWLKEDFYCDNFEETKLNLSNPFEEEFCKENIQTDYEQFEKVKNQFEDNFIDDGSDFDAEDFEQELLDELSSNDSDDDKRTVVEMEDEFDEGISDYNERGGPTDESHHDTSECEEAEREADRYANRDANDWNDIENVDEFLDFGIEEGAVGGVSTPYSDPDLVIEQIYNDAVKNRKQSGILRDYENILQENQENSVEYIQYELQNGTEKCNKNSLDDLSTDPTESVIESEHNTNGIPSSRSTNKFSRKSTRLRARYGYNPQVQGNLTDQDVEIDLNYKPKREYNWRKNFKLDDESPADDTYNDQIQHTNCDVDEYLQDSEDLPVNYREVRHYSLGGESITLFSQSPVREQLEKVHEEDQIQELQSVEQTQNTLKNIDEQSTTNEKPKKRKSKKKSRKSTKIENDNKDEEDSENQMYSRRSSSLQMETDSPRRKSRSRRSSKSSLANEESVGLFSPRNSMAFVDGIVGIAEELSDATEITKKKKTSKRKRAKGEAPRSTEIDKEEHVNEITPAPFNDTAPVSVSPSLTTESLQENLLASVSGPESASMTPASISSSEITNTEASPSISSNTSAAVSNANPKPNSASAVDTFDILKDANFYPLF